jgi:mRNA interferase RelE/StbE
MTTVKLSDEATEDFEALPKQMKDRIAKMLVRLEAWPLVSGTKQLKGNLAGLHRARVGNYRMIFSVQDDVLTVQQIGHRKDVYED